ncbi:MAG: ABC transporter ATP-binding protein [Bdellovibrionales bacterium]|nr:ABC transporter ATP-binding protein [Bdellovibrionales bacterium]
MTHGAVRLADLLLFRFGTLVPASLLRQLRRFRLFSGVSVAADVCSMLLIPSMVALLLSSPSLKGEQSAGAPHDARMVSNLLDLNGFLDYIPFSLPLLFLGCLICSSLFSVLISAESYRLAMKTGRVVSQRLFNALLRNGRRELLARPKSELREKLLHECHLFSVHIVLPSLSLVPNVLRSLSLSAVLFVTSPRIALPAMLLVVLAYSVIFLCLRSKLKTVGNRLKMSQYRRAGVTSDALSTLDEIGLYRKEGYFSDGFAKASEDYFRNLSRNHLYAIAPRPLLELLCACFLGGFFAVRSYSHQSAAITMVPELAAFFFAVYRILPACQSLYSNLSKIYSHQNFYLSLQSFANELTTDATSSTGLPHPAMLRPASGRIDFLGVTYSHLGSSALLADVDVSLDFAAVSVVVGPSGSGKTTLGKLACGILAPTNGLICVDGVPTTSFEFEAIRARFAYVAQDGQIINGGVVPNVAFGVPEHEVDLCSLERALRLARLLAPEETLAAALQRTVGDAGVCLSGGERKRLLLARALYRRPHFLVLDEMTSETDETLTWELLRELKKNADVRGMLIITHDRVPLSLADVILRVEHGKVVADADFQRKSA